MNLVHARLNMWADIYTQSIQRDADTGQTIRDWTFNRTIRVEARAVISEGIRLVGSTEEYARASASYKDIEWVKMRTSELLSKRERVTNIRSLEDGDPLWIDEDGTSIKFEILGSQPMPDPFGRVYLYETILEKVQDGVSEQW